MLDAYEQALPNLRRHATGYPDAGELRRITKAGVDGYGMSAAAEQLENEGVRHIVSVLERDDPRPVWFCAWGGGNTLGGAVMRLRRERPTAEVARLVAKIRGYALFSDAKDAWSFQGTNYHNEYATLFRWRQDFRFPRGCAPPHSRWA